MRADVLVGSALLHGAALALFVQWLPPSEAPRVPARPPIDVAVTPPAEPVIDIAIVDLPPAMVAPLPPALPRAPALPHAPGSPAAGVSVPSRSVMALSEQRSGVPRRAGTAETSAGAEPSAGAAEPSAGLRGHPAGDGESSGPGLLHMRGPDLALAPGTGERIAAGGEPLHGPARESGKLENVPGGGAVIHDRVTTVVVDRDGTAHFHDKPDVEVHFHSPIPHLDFKADMHTLGDALEDWYRDPYAGTRYGPSTDLSEANHAVAGMCDTWGDLGCDDPLAPAAEKRARNRQNGAGVGVHGSADLTSYLYRKFAHADPYASRKLRLLDDTRAERVERGQKFRAEQAARSAELMQRTLEDLWASTSDPAARRHALFELWQDCADDDAGTRARAMVLGWIRAKLPEGSAGAYTADEQAKLDFAPYANDEMSLVSPNTIAPPGTR